VTVGEVLLLTFYTFDADGVMPENATAVTCTITRPDGTTTAPTPSNTSAGVYEATFTPAQVGHHGVYWQATGTNATAKEDAFNVQSSTVFPPVSMSDVKAHLNITTQDNDGELTAFLAAATSAIEQRVGPMTRRTITETHDGGGQVMLRTYPVISLTTVVDNDITLTSDQYRERDGVVTRKSGTSATNFTTGLDGVSITYLAGRTIIPEDLRQAVLEQVRHMWETQRGQQRGRRGGDDYTPGAAYNLTLRVKELIAPYELPGIA
jgi:uncharacterized phiE125 gp8 family phage protein